MTTSDPFLVTAQAVISFSGGRTSGYMLWRVLQAHGGTLPDGVVACFANTGREMPATLDFVRDCGAAWNVPIRWLEFQHGYIDGRKRRTRWADVVSHNSASRDGEPFDRLLESKKIVPDRERRFCSEQLKVLTIKRHVMDDLGWKTWLNVVGLRADEGSRIDEKRASDAARADPFTTIFPLDEAGISKMDVLRFWREMPFDLKLDADGDGGNCDGCFLFSAERIGRMFRKYPERMAWWPNIEARLGSKTMVPGRSYADIRRVALAQGTLPWDDAAPCANSACGV
jgi:3'-phosphoadenosine 5'-phosphosulfate sulfotransferase (PAPS reductase)/FAD synthetase